MTEKSVNNNNSDIFKVNDKKTKITIPISILGKNHKNLENDLEFVERLVRKKSTMASMTDLNFCNDKMYWAILFSDKFLKVNKPKVGLYKANTWYYLYNK